MEEKIKKKNNETILFFLGFAITIILGLFSFAKICSAEPSGHIIINEIQTAGKNSNDEFVELFNPTDAPIVLDGYKLAKKTKGGTESTLLSSSTSTKFQGTIAAQGYFLISHPTYKDTISADLSYTASNSIANDNTILLYNKSGTLLDKVGSGAAIDFENTPAPNPPDSQSIERKNFVDTDNNADDFTPNKSPSPQNSSVVETGEEELENNTNSDQDETENDDGNQDLSEKCLSSSADIKLNEISPYPEDENEFVEIFNSGESCVDVSGWKIMDEAGHKKSFPENSILNPNKYSILEGNLYLNNDADTVYLLDSSGNSQNEALDNIHYDKAKKNFSYSFDGKNWRWSTTPTPGIENLITEDKPAEKTNDAEKVCEKDKCPTKIYLSEILANPKKDEKNEYIELVNKENETVDLFGWTIRDASKTGKYIFKEHTELKSDGYLTLYRPDTKLSLNNSQEAVYLFNPAGELTSSAAWQKAPVDVSYNFDGKSWKWSKFLTPGKENKYDKKPELKITKPNIVYKDTMTNFSVTAKDKETKHLKYVWDFGDGHKSYLKKTSHKYQKTKNYTVKLAVNDASQSVEKEFNISVKKYPRPEIRIVKIVPNPAGLDSQNETLTLKNNSKQKINLLNYKIATGTDPKKLANHPITTEMLLAPEEKKIITRADSKLVLNNKAGKVALLYPDGKVADEIDYTKEKIGENEAYALANGQWQWITPENKNEIAEASQDNIGIVAGAETENEKGYATFSCEYTLEDYYIFLSAFGLLQSNEGKINCCEKNYIYPSPAYLLTASL